MGVQKNTIREKMKIVRDLMFFEVHLEAGEDITELISNISNFEKTFDADQNTWYIRNSSLSYFFNLIKDDKQLSLF